MKFTFKRNCKGLSKAVIALLIIQWLAAPLHFASESHKYCRQHDQYEHSHGKSQHSENADNTKDLLGESENFDHDANVDACGVMAIAKISSSITSGDSSCLSYDVPALTLAVQNVGEAFNHSIELHLLAPKNSPPTV